MVILFPLDKYPDVELLDHVVVLFVIFKGTSILFSTVAAPIYILNNSAQGFPFLHILTNTCFFLCFDESHSDRCEVIAQCGFNLCFPDD